MPHTVYQSSDGLDWYSVNKPNELPEFEQGSEADEYNRAQMESFMPGFDKQAVSVSSDEENGCFEVRHDDGSGTKSRVKDKSNSGYFENEMSRFFASDKELLQAIEVDRLVLGNNNWIEYDGYIVYRGKKYFIDLGDYDNITESNNILEAIDEVLDKYKVIKEEIKREFFCYG